MHPALKLKRIICWIFSVAAPAALFVLAIGPVSGAEPAKPKPEETVELSPFVVSADSDAGWLASNTMLSSRTNQELKTTPVTIESMTPEFLLDMGVYDAYGAAEWAANSAVTSEADRMENTGATPPDTNRYSYRGIPNEGGPTRNLFAWDTPADSYNIERIDFGRGSNSLLFGDTEPGGQANIYTKRAKTGRNFGTVLFQVGSFNAYRTNLDYNASFSEKLAVRLNVTRNHTEADYDWYEKGLQAEHFAITYQPFKNTIIRGEAEYGEYTTNLGTNRLKRFQNPSPGLGFNQRYTILPNKTIVDNRSLPTIDRTAAGGSLLSYLDVDSGLPRSMNFEAVRTNDQNYYTYSAHLEQRIGKLGLDVGVVHQSMERNAEQNRSNNQVRFDSNGRPYLDFAWGDTTNKFFQDALLVTAIYDLHLANWVSQRFVASANWTKWQRHNYILAERNYLDGGGTSTAVSAAAARPWYRVYLDDPTNYDKQYLQRYDIPKSATVDIRPWAQQEIYQIFPQQNFSLSANGRYFKDRLFSSVGIRLDGGKRLTNAPWAQATVNRNQYGAQVASGWYSQYPDHFTVDPAIPGLHEVTHNYGLVFAFNQNINIYTTVAESFRQANGNAVDLAGESIGQQRGKTFEVGIKSDFLNHKLSWNLNYYDLERSNVEMSFPLTTITVDQLEELFNPNDLTPASPGYLSVDGNGDRRSQFSTGIESTFTLYFGEGWNIRVSAASQKVTQDKSLPQLRGLLAEAIARGNENPAYIAAVQEIIAGNGKDGQVIAGREAAKLSFNYAVMYQFPKGRALSGLSLGVNGRYNGDYIFLYINDQPVNGGKRLTANGFVGYRTRWWGRPVTLRLNVANLLEDDYITTDVINVSGAPRNINSYGPPRSFQLTATTAF